MDSFLKIYLPIFVIGFLALVFVAPSIRVYRRTGINPFRFETKQNKVHDFMGGAMKAFILLLLSTVFVYSLSESAYVWLVPFEYLNLQSLKIVGLILVHLSTIGIVTAQLQMNQSWRIGIDYENKTQLITSGFFSKSRNPIFLILLVTLFGLFMILPNTITFAVLFSSYLVLQITMRLEEDFLQKQHGQTYLNYKEKVRRLI